MSFKFYDYKHPVSGEVFERMVRDEDKDEQYDSDGVKLERTMPAPAGSGGFAHGMLFAKRKTK